MKRSIVFCRLRLLLVGVVFVLIGAMETAFSEFYVIGGGGGSSIKKVGPQVMTGNTTSAVLEIVQSGTGDGLKVDTASTTVGNAAVHGVAVPSGITINSYSGVQGESLNGRGVVGISSTSDGLLGFSDSGSGVYGQSISGYGVQAYSKSNAAVKAIGGYMEADAYRFNAPRTNYWSLSGDNFRPRSINSATYFVSGTANAGAYFSTANTADDDLMAPLHLPHGATIKRFEAHFYDTVATNNLTASIIVHNKTGLYITTSLGQVDSSGISGTGSRSNTVSYAVSNSNFFYEIYVRPTSNKWETAGSNLRIIGVTVTYTTSEAY
ncbi:MAG: hypothetical protein EOL87_17735 [Spartobacteria bacterium]|nr:hypothetical protein [Spartobacteria bacterium]